MAATLADGLRRLLANTMGRMQAVRGPRRMELLETLHIGGKQRLMLIMCDGQRYLIGAGSDGVAAIEHLSATPEVSQTKLGAQPEGRMRAVSSNRGESIEA
jgi:flagellar biogenesis protein FliO